MKIFQRSLRNICKDLSKIFAKIRQDLQGFYQDQARILGKIPKGSLVRSFKILEDSKRIFDYIKILQESLVRSQKDLCWDPSRSLRII